MDEQAGSYFTFGEAFLQEHGVLRPDQRIDYVLYNFLRKGKTDPRPQNEKGQYLNKRTKAQEKANLPADVSKNQPSPLFHREMVFRGDADRKSLFNRTWYQWEEMELIAAGELHAHKNPTADCKWDCQFKDMCELHESGSDWEAYRDSMFTVWDPYAAHEDKATD